jgi:hypothetical protein
VVCGVVCVSPGDAVPNDVTSGGTANSVVDCGGKDSRQNFQPILRYNKFTRVDREIYYVLVVESLQYVEILIATEQSVGGSRNNFWSLHYHRDF